MAHTTRTEAKRGCSYCEYNKIIYCYLSKKIVVRLDLLVLSTTPNNNYFYKYNTKKKRKDNHIRNYLFSLSGKRGSNPRPPAWKASALSTELFPQYLWAVMDSNHRRRKPAELQSAPFGHSGNCPC